MCAASVTGSMVEMLRNPDNTVAASAHWFCKLRLEMSWRLAAIAVAAALAAAAQPGAVFEERIEAAIHREIVLGDLAGAMEQYRALLAQPGIPRAVAARALLETGECLEKLGKEKEAYSTYRRVVNEYADQAAIFNLASTKLAAPSGPRNLKFEEGTPGKVPPGWRGPALPKDANYMADLRRDGCRSRTGCAVVMAPVNVPGQAGNLMQSFGATAYRGKTVRLSAWLKLEQFFSTDYGGLRMPGADDRAQLWLRVVRANRRIGFSDQMDDRPVRSSEWTRCDIVGEIDEDAQFINFGVMSIGGGRAWIDDVSFEVISN